MNLTNLKKGKVYRLKDRSKAPWVRIVLDELGDVWAVGLFGSVYRIDKPYSNLSLKGIEETAETMEDLGFCSKAMGA